jgi:glycosyltransferase involved in cell wall biosynthesis
LNRQSIVFGMTGACATPGGIATANLNVLHALVDLSKTTGARLSILSYLEQASDRPPFMPVSVEFKAFAGSKSRFTLDLLSRVRHRPLFVFDHVTLSAPMLPLSVTGIARTVIFAHGSEAWKRIRKTSGWCFQHARLCITNSHYTLGKMRERFTNFKGVACPLGLSPGFPLNLEASFESDEKMEMTAADGQTYVLGEKMLLLVARMHPGEREKGHYELLEVMPRLLKRFRDVQLVFAGPGEDAENLRRMAQAKGVAGAVFLPGRLPVETLHRLYRYCYAFVMPSQQEGFGLVYLEAMNYAKACVGCYEQGAEDIILPGQTGFLVRDPSDSEELFGVLQRLLSEPAQTRELGINGFKRLHASFTALHYQGRVKEQIGALL